MVLHQWFLKNKWNLIKLGLMLLGIVVNPTNIYADYTVIPGDTELTVSKFILKTGDAVLFWVRIIGIIIIILSLIISGILIVIGQWTHNYGYMQQAKVFLVVGPVIGLFIILAAPLITAIILRFFGLGTKWQEPGFSETGDYFTVP